MSQRGWVGVDLDGTLAKYDGWKGPFHVGEPVEKMVARVREWLSRGVRVKIFTARVSPAAIAANGVTRASVEEAIKQWCLIHLGQELPVTHEKDFTMAECWDDRAVQVVANTGERADDQENRPTMAVGTEAGVVADIVRRQQLGIQKYGTTVAENPLSLKQWLNHAYEETLDKAIYLKRAIEEIDRTEAGKC